MKVMVMVVFLENKMRSVICSRSSIDKNNNSKNNNCIVGQSACCTHSNNEEDATKLIDDR